LAVEVLRWFQLVEYVIARTTVANRPL